MLSMLILQLEASGQSPSMVCVSGKVTVQITGDAIPQLSVEEINSGIGTITADDGSFSLLLRPGNITLHFFSEAYLPDSKAFTLTRDTTLQVNLSAMESIQRKKERKANTANSEHAKPAL